MISIFIYIIFIILLILLNPLSCWYIFQFTLLLIILFFVLNPIDSYFSSISYRIGIDYFSYGLILLRVLIVSLIIISRNKIKSISYINTFLLICLFLCLILICIFCFMNIFIIYLFFEFRLIPLLLLIFGWGYQPDRLLAGLYLFFYTLFASLPLFLVLIYLYLNNNSLFFEAHINYNSGGFIFYFCLIFAFLVKLPMFIVHFWLPKAHVQAPISGSIILAGLLLKIGGYGVIRISFIFEKIFSKYNYIWYSFSVVGAILVRLICLIQGDIKCLIAYSSVAHIGLCLIGIISISKWGVLGSYFIIISHGLCSSGLFCLANISYERILRRSFFLNKGLLNFIPRISLIWFLFRVFNIGCPPRLNFLREILILSRIIFYWSFSSLYFLFISFFSACFRIFLFSFSQHGVYNFLYRCSGSYVREFLLLTIHLIPLIIILLGLNFFFI